MNSVSPKSLFEPEIKLEDDGHSVFLSAPAIGPHAPASVAWLMQQIHTSTYAKSKIFPVAITCWVKNYNNNADFNEKVIVAELINAQCEIKIDPEAMGAYLYITPAMGGDDISRRDIIAAIIESRITCGVINRSISEALENPDASKLLIAKGKPPKHGRDSVFKIVLPSLNQNQHETKLGRQLSGGSTFDADDLTAMTPPNILLNIVEPGDILVKRLAHTSGIDGRDIYGNIVSAYHGQELEFTSNAHGVLISECDPNISRAAIYGQAKSSDNQVIVLPLVEIEQVDTSTGDIDFDGSIHIKGNVTAGMNVEANGDIFIDGNVEYGATLKAHGDIIIKGGVFGKLQNTDEAKGETSHSSNSENVTVQISSMSDIVALCLQHTIVNAKKSLFVTKSITQCQVETGIQVIVGQPHSNPGIIDGGSIKSKYCVKADILGSPDAVLTRIRVGDTQAILAQCHLLDSEIEVGHQKRGELEQALAQCISLPVYEGAAKKSKSATLEYLNGEILEVTNLIMLYQVERQKCLTELHALHQSCIHGSMTINPNLRIKIDNHSQTVRNPHVAGRFVLHKNNIDYIPD